MKVVEATSRAMSHIRYWQYRRSLNNGGPSFVASVRAACARFWFEVRNIK